MNTCLTGNHFLNINRQSSTLKAGSKGPHSRFIKQPVVMTCLILINKRDKKRSQQTQQKKNHTQNHDNFLIIASAFHG